jgi:hypothetical protein
VAHQGHVDAAQRDQEQAAQGSQDSRGSGIQDQARAHHREAAAGDNGNLYTARCEHALKDDYYVHGATPGNYSNGFFVLAAAWAYPTGGSRPVKPGDVQSLADLPGIIAMLQQICVQDLV